jgi:hypothetical protein
MGYRKQSIPFCYPEIVSRVILMVMRVDYSFRMECITESEESISTVNEPRIDQKPIHKKGVDFVNGNT